MPYKLFTHTADTVGNQTGEVDAIADYSGAGNAQEFKVTAQVGEHMIVTRCMVSMRAATIGQITGYGGGAALTVGMKVYVTDVLGNILYYIAGGREGLKTNAHYGAVSFDSRVIPGFAAGDDVFHCRWTFAKYGGNPDHPGVELLPGWSINVLCQDDLSVGTSGLLRHVFLMEGHYHQPTIGNDEGHA